MGLFTKKKQSPFSREQSLRAVVIPSDSIAAARTAGGLVALEVPFRTSPLLERLTKWAGGKMGTRTVELDEVGSFVWDLFDGKTTVREMIDRLAARYKLNRKEAEVSITAFIRTLGKKGLVAIAVPQS